MINNNLTNLLKLSFCMILFEEVNVLGRTEEVFWSDSKWRRQRNAWPKWGNFKHRQSCNSEEILFQIKRWKTRFLELWTSYECNLWRNSSVLSICLKTHIHSIIEAFLFLNTFTDFIFEQQIPHKTSYIRVISSQLVSSHLYISPKVNAMIKMPLLRSIYLFMYTKK